MICFSPRLYCKKKKTRKKPVVSWLETFRKQVRRERETPFARTEATPSRQNDGLGSEARRPPQLSGKKQRLKIILKFYIFRFFLHLN